MRIQGIHEDPNKSKAKYFVPTTDDANDLLNDICKIGDKIQEQNNRPVHRQQFYVSTMQFHSLLKIPNVASTWL